MALQLCRSGHSVQLWGHDPDHVRDLSGARENRAFLPGFPLPPPLTPQPDLAEAVGSATDLLV